MTHSNDTALAEVWSALPSDNGERVWALAVGRDFDWPKVGIGRGESIVAGEKYWQLFFARCDEGQLARAIAALRALGGTDGEPADRIDVYDDFPGAVPEDVVDTVQLEEETP